MRLVIEQADFLTQELMEIIDQLPSHHKQVFNLYVIDNFSHEEIGKALDISPGTSKSHLARARKKIRELLYSKALEKQAERKESRRARLPLLFLSVNSSYVDRIFRRGLQNIAFKPSAPLDFDASINWNTIKITSFKGRLQPRVKYWIYGGGAFLILAGFLLIRQLMKEDDPGGSIKTSVLPASSDSIPTGSKMNRPCVLQDSIQHKDIKDRAASPVIIEKTIIERKTVIVHDTVQIPDQGHAR
jgi:hypothetical protein